MEVHSPKSATTLRAIVQWCFMAWVVGIGIRFGMFAAAMERGAVAPLLSRPPGVEGFLPIGALASLKYCPEQNVLAMQPVFWKRPLPVWVFPAVLLFIFTAAIATGMVSGHWHGSLSPADYRHLIPLAPYLSH